MKGSRIAAVGLVAAAGLWIASGHLMPHESTESRASIRPSVSSIAVHRAEVGPAPAKSRSPSTRSFSTTDSRLLRRVDGAERRRRLTEIPDRADACDRRALADAGRLQRRRVLRGAAAAAGGGERDREGRREDARAQAGAIEIVPFQVSVSVQS